MSEKITKSENFSLDDLYPDSRYAMQVRSFSGNSYSEWSPALRFNTSSGILPHIFLVQDSSLSYFINFSLGVDGIAPGGYENLIETDNGDGTYTVSAVFDWDNSSVGMPVNCIDVLQFGYNSLTGKNNQIANGKWAFLGSFITNSAAIQNLDTSNLTDMSNMFRGCDVFNTNLSAWDTSNVTDMSYMFYRSDIFNQNIGGWDVSNVTNMEAMFYQAYDFNGNISSWSTGSVSDMDFMFYQSSSFNQDLSGWCVSLIPSEPTDFGLQATSWTLPKPVWGTCP